MSSPELWEERLQREAELWEKTGIITPAQQKKIISLYPFADEKERHKERSGKLVSTLTVLGAILLGIGVILFFASNWQKISTTFKLILIFSALIITYALGYYFAFTKQNYPRVGYALIFLGSIFYGAAIWLIAQIFHINAHYPNGVLFWMLGILPIAWLCQSQIVLILAALLAALWTVMEQGNFSNANYLFPLIVAGAIIPLTYKIKSNIALVISLLGLILWAGMANVLWVEHFRDGGLAILLSLLVLTVSFYELGSYHLQRESIKAQALPYRVVGLLGSLFVIYLLTFQDILVGYGSSMYFQWLKNIPYLVLYGFLLLFAVVTTGYNIYKQKSAEKAIYEHIGILGVLIIINVVSVIPYFLRYGYLSIFNNLLLFFMIVGLLVLGYKKGDALLINVSLLFFVIDVISRYFDFFWKLMPRSVFFMVGGILLLAGGTFLERSRRKLLQDAGGGQHVA